MIIDPTLLLKIMPTVAAVTEKVTGKKTGLPEILSLLPEITEAFKSPNITQTPTPTEGSGLQIGGAVGETADYNSQIPGVQGFGNDFKNSGTIFDPNYNTQQLGIKKNPYNNTPYYSDFLEDKL